MMKKWLLWLAVMLAALLCAAAAEPAYEITGTNRVFFPEYNGMTATFRNAETWTFVTRENLDEHLDLVLARGGTEEEIRERYARESFLFEAYSPELPADCCVRMERFTTELTRSIWNGKHLDQKNRQEFIDEAEMGMLLPWYIMFDSNGIGTGENAGLHAFFTSVPPATLESGYVRFYFINGTVYTASFCISGRLAGKLNLMTAEDIEAMKGTPATRYTTDALSFSEEKTPQLPAFELKEALPTQADVGDLTVTGSIREGGALTVTVDGEKVPAKVGGNGQFTVTLPLMEEGDREVAFTVSHPRNTTRVETYTVNVSSIRTKLTFTDVPTGYVLPGKQLVAGETDPHATVRLTLDEEEPVEITADASGAFSYTFDLPDSRLHHLRIMATAPDYKDTFKAETYFYTLHATFLEGMQAFGSKIVDAQVKDIARAPADYVGERVMINVHIREVEVIDVGLGLTCRLIIPGYMGGELYAYVTVYGYANCEPHRDMVLTVYGTVQEPIVTEDGQMLNVLMEYATYSRY
ncbi:MAG: hypothetical protein E7327_03375 [Clostridiales bacterium]|nr:hypothetical protein [Clostridiales bacterium]